MIPEIDSYYYALLFVLAAASAVVFSGAGASSRGIYNSTNCKKKREDQSSTCN